MSVVLDLTPNYKGSAPWFQNDDEIVEKVKVGPSSERALSTQQA